MSNCARIKFLLSNFGNDSGDIVNVIQETDNEIDYYDSSHRWCYVLKSEEGITYHYISKGDRLNSKRNEPK